MVQTIEVPARDGRAVNVVTGERFAVVDVAGGQVGDLFAFNAEDVSEYASAEHTRVALSRLFPQVGESFCTNRRRPILRYESDSSPGVHDMLSAACDPTRYQLLGATGWHASCQENLERAMRELGHDRIEIPQPINLFMNIPVLPDGSLDRLPAVSQAGDAVTLVAEMDCIIVLSACPQDMTPINRSGPQPLELRLLDR